MNAMMHSKPDGRCLQEGGACAEALPAAAEEAEDGLLAPGSGPGALLLCHAAQALVHAAHRQGCRLDQHRLQHQPARFSRSALNFEGCSASNRSSLGFSQQHKMSATDLAETQQNCERIPLCMITHLM